MSDAKSNYLEDLVLDTIFRTGPGGIRPASIWISLWTSDPTDAGTGNEMSVGNYVRVQVPQDDTWWSLASGSMSNLQAIQFAVANANWGTAGWFGVHDLSAAGNLLYHGALTTPKGIDSGDQFQFQVGDLTISET